MNEINKHIIMLILQKRGIISYDDENYNDIKYSQISIDSPDIDEDEYIHISGIAELISIKDYMKFSRDLKLKELLDE